MKKVYISPVAMTAKTLIVESVLAGSIPQPQKNALWGNKKNSVWTQDDEENNGIKSYSGGGLENLSKERGFYDCY